MKSDWKGGSRHAGFRRNGIVRVLPARCQALVAKIRFPHICGDIRQLSEYLHAHTDADLGSAEEEELCEYIDWMRSNGKSVATVSRAIASLKNFYGFLLNNHYVQHNPTGKLVPDKAKQKLPQILSSKEVELLLAQPECTDAKGLP